jgi:hypothetical protein
MLELALVGVVERVPVGRAFDRREIAAVLLELLTQSALRRIALALRVRRDVL